MGLLATAVWANSVADIADINKGAVGNGTGRRRIDSTVPDKAAPRRN